MEASEVQTLGSDLVLLAIDPARGKIRRSEFLRYSLMGSELVRLIAAGQADIADGRIVVAPAGSSGDVQLDAALASVAAARRPPRVTAWIGRPRRQIVTSYLSELQAAGAVASSGSGRKTRWRITDPVAVAAARARLDQAALPFATARPAGVTLGQAALPSATAGSAGVTLGQAALPSATARPAGFTLGQAAFAGLAHAAQLDQVLYRGRGSRAIRKRCAQLGRGRLPAGLDALASAPTPADAAIQAAVAAAIRASAAAASSAG